jgi:predicted nucleic acid-binding protein
LIIVDASVVFEYLIDTGHRSAIEARFVAEGFELHAPSHFHLELLSVLRKQTLYRGRLAKDEMVLREINRLPITIRPYQDLIPRIWQLRHNITTYDAAYVALAEALDAPLLTRDRKLAKSKGHHARIEAI